MSDEEQIRRTLAEFCVFLDGRRFREWSELFTEDGVFCEHVTRAAIFAWISGDELATRPDLRRKHTVHNILIDVDGDRARATADLVMYDKVEDRPWFILTGTYTDHLVREADRWRFSNRQLALLAAGDA
jgi:3-phenylpropionate/cinnamic acid dioxygenase small subunit